MNMRSTDHPCCRAAGFTLIEVLIVIGIIGLLTVVLIPNLTGAQVRGEIADTEARLLQLRTAIDKFERENGAYPPDNFAELKTKVTSKPVDAHNAGIESLVAHLHPKAGRGPLADKQEWLSNTDGDSNGTTIPGLDTAERVEVTDAWGTPFAYFAAQFGGYDRPQRIKRKDGEEVEVRARKGKNGKPLGPDRYQLLSAGPDGVFGNEDDIGYPELANF